MSVLPALFTTKSIGDHPLHQTFCGSRFAHVKERYAVRAVLFLVIASLLSACASSEDSMSGDSASPSATSGTPVPGEKLSDEGRFTPGAAGAGGNVHW